MAKFFDVPFAEQGDKDPVPTDAQPNGSVSYITGYTPDYEIDLDIDDPNAKPVERGSMNDLFHDITEALGFIQKHGAADWSTAGKPYALNDIVRFGDKNWLSLVPVNNDQPVEGLSWTEFSANLLKGKLDRIDVVQATGTQVGKVMSQKATTDLLELKLDKSSVKQSSGNSSSDIMSQRAVGESINAAIAPKADSVTVNQQLALKYDKITAENDLALKLDKSSVKTSKGQSSFDVMSQKATTDELEWKSLPSLKEEFGFQKLPSGLIFQWGKTLIGDNQTLIVNLPVAFTTAFFNVTASLSDLVNGAGYVATISARPSGLSSLRLKAEYSYGTAYDAYWFAIGI